MPRPTPLPKPASQFGSACCLALILVLLTGVVTAMVVVVLLLAASAGGHLPTPSEKERTALPPSPQWKYEARQTGDGAKIYLFNGSTQPPLTLTKDGAITDHAEINRVQATLQLPPVDRNVPELETITGLRGNRATFLWDDYALGELRVYRTLVRNHALFGGEHQNVIWKVTVSSRPAKR